MAIFKKIAPKKGEMTLGILLAAIVSMAIIAVCLIQMEGCDGVKFVWFLFFVAANIVYISVGMKGGRFESDPMNALVIASGPLAFFFWTVVGVWNKYIASATPVKFTEKKAINKKVIGKINKWAADANEKMPVGTKTYPVNNVIIRSPTDVLRDLNDEITEKLKRFDVFDIDVPEISIKRFLQVITKRNLDWRPTDFVYDNKETIVVGKKGVDFGQYEEAR